MMKLRTGENASKDTTRGTSLNITFPAPSLHNSTKQSTPQIGEWVSSVGIAQTDLGGEIDEKIFFMNFSEANFRLIPAKDLQTTKKKCAAKKMQWNGYEFKIWTIQTSLSLSFEKI